VSYGFGEVVYQTGLGKLLHAVSSLFHNKRKNMKQIAKAMTTWARIRMAVEALGPTFIKLGQILSNRPDLIPRALRQELTRLQRDVPPFPAEQAIALIEEELDKPLRDLFKEFDKTPVAAASIAQVHRAVLHGGEVVAVKVQRPNLKELVQIDVEILKEIAVLLERYVPESRRFSPRDIVNEFEHGIIQELDFCRESAAIARFAAQFQGDNEIKVPFVYSGYCSKRVLTMEFIEGQTISGLLAEKSQDSATVVKIAMTGVNLTLKQIFTYGFFHADPHPGNILILGDGRLCYIDFGLTGSLIQRDLEVISDMFVSIMNRNEQKAAKAVIRLADSRDYRIAQKIERKIGEIISRFQSSKAGDFLFTGLLSEIIEVLVGVGLRLPTDLYLLVKSLITIEGVATGLDAKFNFGAQLKPFAETLVKERYGPERIISKVITMAEDYGELLQNIAGDYYRITDMLSDGRRDDKSIDPARRTALQARTTLVSAVVIGSIIIGSALIIISGIPPLWHKVPIIGIAGFIIAGIVSLCLFIKILRTV